MKFSLENLHAALGVCIHSSLMHSSVKTSSLVILSWSLSCLFSVCFVFCVLSGKKFGGRDSYLYPKDIKA